MRYKNSIQGHLRVTFHLANKITAVKILAGSLDMCFFFTEEPKWPDRFDIHLAENN